MTHAEDEATRKRLITMWHDMMSSRHIGKYLYPFSGLANINEAEGVESKG